MLSIDTGYVTRVLQDLVRINSVNPVLDPAAPGERAIAEYVGEAMSALGADVRYHEPKAGRVSVVATLGGSAPRWTWSACPSRSQASCATAACTAAGRST